MVIDWWTLGFQTVNALILIWILARFFFRPVADIIAKRQGEVEKTLEKGRAMQEEAKQEEAKAEADRAAIRDEKSELMSKAAKEAEARKSEMLKTAKAEVQKMHEEAKAEIARERDAATAQQARRASRLAADIASRLLDRLPDGARVAGFVDGLAEAAGNLPESARKRLLDGGGPLPLQAPRALTDAEAEACRKALSGALGQKVEITVTETPELIAGLEIDTPQARLRNSFRADLERIVKELTRDESDAE